MIPNIEIKKRPQERIESLLSRFKRKEIKSGIIREVRQLKYFESPSEENRRKRKESTRRVARERV